MHLWTEYEGNILGGYPLGRLTRSEGRSAFFSTVTPDGKPALLRLTESHFDDSELVGRWQQIAAVQHPNLQGIAHFGQLTFDEVLLACCLLEPVDMSLADVLRERPLTVDETKEVALAAASALAALHAAGLIHAHLDATNVFSHGETVKLRSDCARACHGDFEADTEDARAALRQRDVHDLGLLLLRCLAVDWPATAAAAIPAPFDHILPRALDGKLTAEGLVAALEHRTPATPIPIATSSTANTPQAVLASIADRAQVPIKPTLGRLRSLPREQPAGTFRLKFNDMRAADIRPRTYLAASAAAILLGIILWNTTISHHPEPQPHAAVEKTAQPIPTTQTTKQPRIAQAKPSATVTQASLFTTGAQAGWRVIAYTYNQEQQAQAKAAKIGSRYATLHPQVFSPTGHAPYFVALGGPSDAASAMALRNRARHSGLPRDTYARNF